MSIVHSNNPVRLNGEELDKVLWQGRTWAVTEYGIERRDGQYTISVADLANGVKRNWPSWPSHIRQKASTAGYDYPDFCTAYFVALTLHGVTCFSPDVLCEAINYEGLIDPR